MAALSWKEKKRNLEAKKLKWGKGERGRKTGADVWLSDKRRVEVDEEEEGGRRGLKGQGGT